MKKEKDRQSLLKKNLLSLSKNILKPEKQPAQYASALSIDRTSERYSKNIDR